MGDLAGLFGGQELELALPGGTNVGELLKHLCNHYGVPFAKQVFTPTGSLRHTVVIFVNGQDIKQVDGLETRLAGSEVEVFMLPMFEGG